MFNFGRHKDRDAARFRPRHPKGTKRKIVFLSLFSTVVASYNATLIVKGFVTGEIKNLGRSSESVTMMATEPGWFVYNVLFRLFAVVLFGFATFAMWKEARNTF
jgi:hypothetical protein